MSFPFRKEEGGQLDVPGYVYCLAATYQPFLNTAFQS